MIIIRRYLIDNLIVVYTGRFSNQDTSDFWLSANNYMSSCYIVCWRCSSTSISRIDKYAIEGLISILVLPYCKFKKQSSKMILMATKSREYAFTRIMAQEDS